MRNGKIIAVVGSTGSGKTVFVHELLKDRTRILVWDPEMQYPCDVRVHDQLALARLVAEVRHRPLRICYTPSDLADFDFWAEVAFCWVRFGAQHNKYSAVVAEEIADVTHPGKAPKNYGLMIRRIRKYHGDLFALTQRPAESDKTVFGNLNLLHCGFLVRRKDRKAIADEMDIDVAMLDSMTCDDQARVYDYVQCNPRRHETLQGVLTFDKPFPHGKAHFSRLITSF